MDFDTNTEQIESLVNVSVDRDAYEALLTTEYDLEAILKRHINQDYGAIPFESKFQNDFAFHQQAGVATSRYPLANGLVVVVTTKWNQPFTRVSLEGASE